MCSTQRCSRPRRAAVLAVICVAARIAGAPTASPEEPPTLLTISDPTGRPVIGATVSLTLGDWTRDLPGTTDAGGRIDLARKGFPFRAVVTRRAHLATWVELPAPETGFALRVVLEPAAVVRGRIVPEGDRRPSEIAFVETGIGGMRGWNEIGLVNMPRAVVGADGRFEFPVVPPGVEYRLVSLTPGLQIADAPRRAATPAEIDLGDVRVVPRPIVSVICLDEDGQPIPGVRAATDPRTARVERGAWQPDGTVDPARVWTQFLPPSLTDAAGRVQLTAETGTGRVWLDGDLFETRTVPYDAAPGDPTVRVVLPRAHAELRGTMVDERGEPIGNGQVTVFAADGSVATVAYASWDGTFRARAMRGTGPWTISALAAGKRTDGRLPLGDLSAPMRVPVRAVAALTWWVSLGEPGRRGTVRYIVETEDPQTHRRRRYLEGRGDGSYPSRVTLPDGRYWLILHADGYEAAIRGPIDVRVAEGPLVPLGRIRLAPLAPR